MSVRPHHPPTARPRRVDPAMPGTDQVRLWMLRCLAYEDMCEAAIRSAYQEIILPYLDIRLDLRRGTAGRVAQALPLVRKRLAEVQRQKIDRSHAVFTNVGHLASLIHLDEAGQELLALASLMEVRHALCWLAELCCESAAGSMARLHCILGAMLELEPEAVAAALEPRAPLARATLLSVSLQRVQDGGEAFDLNETAHFLRNEFEDAAALVAKLVDLSPPAELTAADFDHAAADIALVRTYLASALRQRMRGVNVLVYGPPGTGKTQAARVIAQDVGATLYQVRVAAVEGFALGRRDRFASYQLMQALLQDRREALVLFDEVEDAFPSMAMWIPGETSAKNKGWMNRLLEENPVPAFWLANDVSQIDPAFLRRFDIVVELRIPPVGKRRAILARHLAGVEVTNPWLDRWAADDGVAAADMARAARVVRAIAPTETGGAEQSLDRLLNSQMLIRRGPKPPAYRRGPGAYDLACLNTDADVALLAAAFQARPHGTVCMYGPPGTGKTAFAAWLAESLGRPLLHKRASDLLGKYVGQTEANLARMFREAMSEEAVLLLDEADSFLRDRRQAERPWEVSQVNELLVQMEAHDGIFLCATNLLEQLDPAAFRRFSVKVKFDVLTADQRVRMLLATLHELAADEPADVKALTAGLAGAALGDFAAVTRRYQLLGVKPTALELADAVRAELSFRAPARRAAGFLR